MNGKASHHRNKYFLGELTIGDLIEFVSIEGEFSLGKNWLPIVRSRTSRKRGVLELFMESFDNDPEVSIPLDTRVKIEGVVVHMKVFPIVYPGGQHIRIRLDSPPKGLL